MYCTGQSRIQLSLLPATGLRCLIYKGWEGKFSCVTRLKHSEAISNFVQCLLIRVLTCDAIRHHYSREREKKRERWVIKGKSPPPRFQGQRKQQQVGKCVQRKGGTIKAYHSLALCSSLWVNGIFQPLETFLIQGHC